MSKFKVGDKVIGNAKATKRYGITREGWIGTVAEVFDKNSWDEDFSAIGPGITDKDTVFKLNSKYFDLYVESSQKIVITTDGKTTTAVLYDGKKRVKEAEATCCPTDTFDFNYGANLALERLVGNPRVTELKRRLNSIYSTSAFKNGDLNWNKFAHGELEVKVSKEKWDEFMKLCEEKNFTWSDGQAATTVNPWKMYNQMHPFAQAIADLAGAKPDKHVYVVFTKDEELKFCTDRDEDKDEYEFI